MKQPVLITIGFLLGLTFMLFSCRIELEDSCVEVSTVQAENSFCIQGGLNHCFCPSEDVNVQTQCTTFDLPEREPEAYCEE